MKQRIENGRLEAGEVGGDMTVGAWRVSYEFSLVLVLLISQLQGGREGMSGRETEEGMILWDKRR